MQPETTVGMSYELLVEEGRAARREVDGYQWREGDLALELDVLPPGEGPRDPETGELVADGQTALRMFAEAIDVSYSTLRNYRATAAAWPVVRRRTTVSFQVHTDLAAQSDRFDLIHDDMKLAEARKIVTTRTRGASGKPGWHELLGIVGDTLTKAGKELARVEAEITIPHTPAGALKLAGKALVYGERAAEISERLLALSRRMQAEA